MNEGGREGGREGLEIVCWLESLAVLHIRSHTYTCAQDEWGNIDYEEWGPGAPVQQPHHRQHQCIEEEDVYDYEGNGPWGSAWRVRAALGAAIGDAIRLEPEQAVEEGSLLNILMSKRANTVCVWGWGVYAGVGVSVWEG